jgi:hypothetical protein
LRVFHVGRAPIAIERAIFLIFFICLLQSSVAWGCGQPLTVQDIQRGIMPSEANLPCSRDPGYRDDGADRRQWQRQQAAREKEEAEREFARKLRQEEAAQKAEAAKREAQWKAEDIAKENAKAQLNEINRKLNLENANRLQQAEQQKLPAPTTLPASNPFVAQTKYDQPNPFAKPSLYVPGGYNSGNCSDITGIGGGGGPVGCSPSKGNASYIKSQISSGRTQKLSQPRPRIIVSMTPQLQMDLLKLSDAMMDLPDNDVLREKMRRRLQRRLADHQLPLKQQDLDCLQPTSGTGRRMVDVALWWHPYHIKKEAIDQSGLCNGVPDGTAKEACRENKYGQAVMWAEPEIAGLCRTETMPNQNLDAVAECARRKFENAWANGKEGILSAPPPDRWTAAGICSAKVSSKQKKQNLRDLLIAAMAAANANDGHADEATPQGQQSPVQPASVEQSPPPYAENEAFCAYIARDVARGQLTPDGGTPIPAECKATIAAAEKFKAGQPANGRGIFTMSDVDTDREIKRWLKKSPDQIQPK